MKKGLNLCYCARTGFNYCYRNYIACFVKDLSHADFLADKTVENDGYQAVQVGFGDVKVSRVNKQ